MNVPTIQMEPKIARVHYQAYHRKVLEHRAERRRMIAEKGRELGKRISAAKVERNRLEQEDEELMRAYQAMAKGQRIINLPHVLKAAGAQPETHFPALAVARADWKQCYFRVDGAAFFHEEEWIDWRDRDRATKGTHAKVLQFSQSTFPAETWNTNWRSSQKLPSYPIKAMVPSIPAHLRPADLENYFILWDAVWKKEPPHDPLLLKRASRWIYVVVAQWDLTPLEQSILEGRL